MKRPYIIMLFLVFFCMSCGIDNYLYLYPVSSITGFSDGRIRFTLPPEQASLGDYFRSYRIYYKIYKSPNSIEHNSTSFSTINSALNSHYNTFSSYLSGTDNAPLNIVNIFEGEPRAYHVLEYANKDNPLSGPSIHGKTAVIDFDVENNIEPVLILESTERFPVTRSSSVIQLQPQNNRSFFYNSSVFSGSDVQENAEGSVFAYAAFYIMAIGLDDNMSNAYSSPSYLGLLRLPVSE